MLKKAAALCLSSLLMASTLPADEGRVPHGVPHLDHVFVIVMENHAYKQIIDNPSEPFVNNTPNPPTWLPTTSPLRILASRITSKWSAGQISAFSTTMIPIGTTVPARHSFFSVRRF